MLYAIHEIHKAVSLDVLSVQIGVRTRPQKRNVFCPCFSFQVQCFCGFLLILCLCPSPVLSSSLVSLCSEITLIILYGDQFWNKLDWAYLFYTECKWGSAICIFFPRKVTFEKQWFYLDNIIGHSYGTTFEVTNGGSLQPKKKKEEPTSGTLFWIYEIGALELASQKPVDPNFKMLTQAIPKEM